jgi:protein ImuB
MPRIVSVFLPRWPIQRFLAAQARNPSSNPVDPRQPFVLSTEVSGTPRIMALNEAAEQAGLMQHDILADARAKIGFLQAHPADSAADNAALKRLALWATRYTPAVSCWDEENGADGFFLDVTGAAHLFGGEETLLQDIGARLAHFTLSARLAIADTPAAAWAISRYGSEPIAIVSSDAGADSLAPLPVEALRLSKDTCVTLRRLGFKRIGSLIGTARAPFAARFEKELLRRLDQALGHASEPLDFIVPPPVYHSVRYLMEPVFTTDAIVRMAGRLMQDISHALSRDGVGARDLRLSLYRVDGETTLIDIGLTRPTRDAVHVARLLDLKLERITGDVEAGFGFETLDLAVIRTEPMQDWQTELIADADAAANAEQRAALIDRLRQRLGPRSVRRLEAAESHLPERAEYSSSVIGDAPAWPAPNDACPRPLILLPKAERIEEVLATVPESPPKRFRWRGVLHHVVQAQGPERIAGEWWRDGLQPTRDYYLVEDASGHRFWLYRAGLYGRETREAEWFLHGLFA